MLVEGLALLVFYSGFAATLFLAGEKYGLQEKMAASNSFYLSNLGKCILCLSTHLFLIVALVGVIFGMPLESLLLTLPGGSITRAIINQ